MNLDNLDLIAKIDAQNMIDEINHLPNQLGEAWELGSSADLPPLRKYSQVIVSGMGGSAIGADLLRTYVLPLCKVPVFVSRDYGLPAFAQGADTLFIASSHSGNTEETLDAIKAAIDAECTCMVVTTGGKLMDLAKKENIPAWTFIHKGQPRAAVGYSFGLLLTLFCRLGLIADQRSAVEKTIQTLLNEQKKYFPEVPASQNPAKRYAGQLVGRWVTVFGAGLLSVVAARWKGQINELAKAPANFEVLPEADHNTLAGIINPEELLSPRTFTMFLNSTFDHPRNALRSQITRQTFMVEGLNTDVFTAVGETRLEQMWTTIHFGDYMAYYLAIAYATDPTPVDALVTLKNTLSST